VLDARCSRTTVTLDKFVSYLANIIYQRDVIENQDSTSQVLPDLFRQSTVGRSNVSGNGMILNLDVQCIRLRLAA